MRILVTGITGAIGSVLAPRLLADGHQVRGLTRDPDAAQASGRVPERVELVGGDVVTGEGLGRACEGIDIAYYLIHSMEPLADARLEALELTAAEHFRAAAGPDGSRLRRVIYLGGMQPPGTSVSSHMASRLRVEQVVRQAAPESTGLRASIVIGSRSRSFRLLVRLIERMPVLVLPAWRDHLTAPVDQRDVTESLARAATAQLARGRRGGKAADQIFDLAGPEVVSYGGLIERIRDAMLVDRPLLMLPGLTLTPLASRLSAAISGEEHALIGPLMESLSSDLLPNMPNAAERFGVRQHSLRSAIENALREWEQVEPLRAR
jgi:uncharacterized protein YbjT (DUF2867 family)